MKELANEGNNIQFIDVDKDSELASKYGVRSVPTVVIEDGGVEVDRFVGVLPKNKVMERIS
jgi:thioredoxin 1